MTLEATLSRWFRMTDEVWARHANPWSVWTRYPCLPLLALAVWSRSWIGAWAWVPALIVVAWIWLNPRVFPKPETTNAWASRAVLGERVWLNRDSIPVPPHHATPILVLNTISGVGALLTVAGLVMLHAWMTTFGVVLATVGKSWFLDRMVWLYDEMRDANDLYRSWLY